MKFKSNTALAALALALSGANAFAQSAPSTIIQNYGTLPAGWLQFADGNILPTSEWAMLFAAKQDALGFTPERVLNPMAPPYNAKCDGSTPDTVALQMMAAAVTPWTHVVIPGSCAFTSPLTFPLVNYVRLTGGQLLYTGPQTTSDLVQIGQGGNNTCKAQYWSVEHLSIANGNGSPLSGGAALKLGDVCESDFNDIRLGEGYGNMYNGLVVQGGGYTRWRGSHISGAANIGEMIYGDPAQQYTNWWQDQASIANSKIGLDIAGEVGGFYAGSGEYLNNGENVRISRDGVNVSGSKQEVFFGPGLYIDGTDVALFADGGTATTSAQANQGDTTLAVAALPANIAAGQLIVGTASGTVYGNVASWAGTTITMTNAEHYTIPSGTALSFSSSSGDGIHITDQMDPANLSKLEMRGTWVSYQQGHNVHIESQAQEFALEWQGGDLIANRNPNLPAFQNDSTYAGEQIQLVGTRIVGNDGADVQNATGAKSIALSSVYCDTSNCKTSGDVTVMSTGPNGTMRFNNVGASIVMQTTLGNIILQPDGTYAVIAAPGGAGHTGIWFTSGAAFPGDGGAVTKGGTYEWGSPSYPFDNGYFNILDTPTVLNSSGDVNMTSLIGNAGIRAEATHAAVICAGTTSSQIGLWVKNGAMTPGLCDKSAQGGVMDLGNSSQPFRNGSFSGAVTAPQVQSTGSAPTAGGTCAVGSFVGGNTMGQFTLSAACSSGTISLTFAQSFTHAPICSAVEETTKAATFTFGAATPNSYQWSVAGAASGDVIQFDCSRGY